MMEQQIRRYVFGAAGAGFVLIWTTLGLRTATLSVVGALVAANYQRLIGIVGGRRQLPSRSRQRPAMRVRSLREESDDALPMVPDEPSLIINASGF
jgi:hypothetical protein